MYLGDTARLPYGTKTPATVLRYAQQAARRLADEQIKMLVVGCNTASGFALTDLAARYGSERVCGVIEPGAAAAAACADERGVLVLATESTIAGGAYQQALAPLLHNAPVRGRACPLWVTLAEVGPSSDTLVEAVLQDGLNGIEGYLPSVVLLGCTHFPVFRDPLVGLLNRLERTSDQTVSVVDSAATTADVVVQRLQASGLARDTQSVDSAAGSVRYLATDGVERFAQVGAYFLGEPIGEVELIDL